MCERERANNKEPRIWLRQVLIWCREIGSMSENETDPSGGSENTDQAAGPLDQLAIGWQQSLTKMRAEFAERLREKGPIGWLEENAPRLLPLVGPDVTEEELLACSKEDLSDASVRIGHCETCPETGGVCAGAYRAGETVSWEKGQGVVYSPCSEKWKKHIITETVRRCGVPRGMEWAKPHKGWDLVTIGAWLRGVISGQSQSLLILSAPRQPRVLAPVCAAVARKLTENTGLGGRWTPAWVRNAYALEEPVLRALKDDLDPLDCDTTRNAQLVILYGWDGEIERKVTRSIDKMLSFRLRGRSPYTIFATTESPRLIANCFKQCADLLDCAEVVEFRG
jgi:hypothetical protein